MHGSNAFHLAARFDASSLKLLINEVRDRGGAMLLEGLIKAGECGYSALHFAAINRDPSGLR